MKKSISLFLLLITAIGFSGIAEAWYYPSPSCSDTDGINYNTKGTVTYYGRAYTDYCSGSYVKEYYCKYNKYQAYTYYKCPAGCSNGACVQPTYCGDGTCNGAETCSTCVADCGVCPPVCGNGILETGEACDDGNKQNGDGCSSDCIVDCAEDWQCTEYSECEEKKIVKWINGGTQTQTYTYYMKYRTCNDNNNCGTSYNQPPSSAQCTCYNHWEAREDSVNIGDETSEAGHNLQDWGAIEPDTNGGSWGEEPNHSSCCGYGQQPALDGNCRVVSSPYTSTEEASIDLDFGGGSNLFNRNVIDLWVLKGLSGNDDFEVLIDGIKVYEFDDDGTRSQYCNGEDWVKHTITDETLCTLFNCNARNHMGGTHTVTIRSTAPHWSYYDPYGQIAVSKISSRWNENVDVCS